MEFLVSFLLNLVIPVLMISAAFIGVFFYGFKNNEVQPDFKGFSLNEEDEKPKIKKSKPKKSVSF